MSDEGPEDGNDCISPGSDENAIIEAIAAANANQVRVSPILANGYDSCVEGLANRLATNTGGTVFYSTMPSEDLVKGINELVGSVAADQDGDGIADSQDSAPSDPCQPDPQAVCLPRQVCGINNTPHWDDDKDNRVDEELPNAVDDDNDGLTDEDVGGMNCPFPAQDCGINSHRSFDDDGDTRTDEETDDGMDNDGDSYVDEDVACPCSQEQDLGVSDTPGLDDDLDYKKDEEVDDGSDNDGDQCIDEDVSGGPDFYVPYVSVMPVYPDEMESSKLIIGINNVGDPYKVDTGLYKVIVTARDVDSNEYWRYVYHYHFTGDPGNSYDLTVGNFLFLYPRNYQVEAEVVCLDAVETNLSNNSNTSRIVTVRPRPLELTHCERLLADIAIVAAEALLAPGVGKAGKNLVRLEEKMVEVTGKIKRTFSNVKCAVAGNDPSSCFWKIFDQIVDILISELSKFMVEEGFLKSVERFIPDFGATLLTHIVLGMKHAVQCGWVLGDVAIRLSYNMRNRGYSMNTVVVESPVDVVITNSKGERVGYKNGTYLNEIPHSYVAEDEGTKVVFYPGSDTASIEIFGTNSGYFDLTIGVIDPLSNEVVSRKFQHIPVQPNLRGVFEIQTASLFIDNDGDGSVDAIEQGTDVAESLKQPGASKQYGLGIILAIVALLSFMVGLGVYIVKKPAEVPFRLPILYRTYLIDTKRNEIGLKDRFLIDETPPSSGSKRDGLSSTGFAIIRYMRGAWFVQDQRSPSRTYVNGQQVSAIRLKSGDHIKSGGAQFEFRDELSLPLRRLLVPLRDRPKALGVPLFVFIGIVLLTLIIVFMSRKPSEQRSVDTVTLEPPVVISPTYTSTIPVSPTYTLTATATATGTTTPTLTPSLTPTSGEPKVKLGKWIVIVASAAYSYDAAWHYGEKFTDAGYTVQVMETPNNNIRVVVVGFKTEEEANGSLMRIHQLNPKAYVRKLSDWCPDRIYYPNHILCK
jgi:hypothetical protein